METTNDSYIPDYVIDDCVTEFTKLIDKQILTKLIELGDMETTEIQEIIDRNSTPEGLDASKLLCEILQSELDKQDVKLKLQKQIDSLENKGELSDGYHTFNELYEFRKVYNASLFNEWVKQGKYNVHKSIKHFEGDECFGGGWFIVVAMLPTGQISNHYEMKDWDLFKCEATEKALFEFDGHTPKDVLNRLIELDK